MKMHSNEKIIIKFIQEKLLSAKDEIELSGDDDLLVNGLIDSMGIIKLVGFIEERFNVTIPPEDIIIENFMDVNAIVSYIEK